MHQSPRMVQSAELCRRIKENGREKVKWIQLALDRSKWRGLINSVMNLISMKWGGYSMLAEILLFSLGQLLV